MSRKIKFTISKEIDNELVGCNLSITDEPGEDDIARRLGVLLANALLFIDCDETYLTSSKAISGFLESEAFSYLGWSLELAYAIESKESNCWETDNLVDFCKAYLQYKGVR